MAADLFTIEKIVETHRSHLLSKFEVENIVGFLK